MKKNEKTVSPDAELATYDPKWRKRYGSALAEFGAAMAWGGPLTTATGREILAIKVYEAFHAQFRTVQDYRNYAKRNVTEPMSANSGVALPAAVMALAAKNGPWWPLILKKDRGAPPVVQAQRPQQQQQLVWQQISYYHFRP